MSKAEDNRPPVAGYVLPRQVLMPRFEFQHANPKTNSVTTIVEAGDKQSKSGETHVKIKSLQNLRFG
jgi:hypothetical protein